MLLWQTTPFFFFFFFWLGGGVVQPICLQLERLSDAYGGDAKSAREADDADANNLTNKTKTQNKKPRRASKERATNNLYKLANNLQTRKKACSTCISAAPVPPRRTEGLSQLGM
jgi:hypothetical protein